MNFKEAIETKARLTLIKSVCSLLEKNPDKNIPKIFKAAHTFTKNDFSRENLARFEKAYNTMPSVKTFVDNVLKTTNSISLKKLFTVSINNALWLTSDKRKELSLKNNITIPYTLFINPSSKCNLNCCKCASSNNNEMLKAEEIDKILLQAKALGINYVSIIGGEPFLLDFMYDIYKKHDDMIFTVFTNGTLFDEKTAQALSFLGNIIPIISLNDFHTKTDAHKGKKIYDIIMNGMDMLRENRIPFGVYSILSAENADAVVSDNFIDILINKGSKFSLYFNSASFNFYNFRLKPISKNDLEKVCNKIQSIRLRKPYLAVDLINDVSLLKNNNINERCCYIDYKGNIRPDFCYNTCYDNIKNKSLIDIFKEQQFQNIIKYNNCTLSTLNPCAIINNLFDSSSYENNSISISSK